MKKTVCILFMFALLFAGVAGADEPEGSAPKDSAAKTEGSSMKSEGSAKKADESPAPEKAEPEANEPASEGGEFAFLRTSKGPIVIRLFDDGAPEHSKSFRSPVRKGFFNGTYFHRLINDFVIQGGDPNTKDDNEMNDGMGGPGYTVKNESGSDRKHKRGSVAAARTADPDSAGSQFYIALQPLPMLDQHRYTVFGEVVLGMDTVDKIVAVKKKALRPRGEESFPVEKTYIEEASLITAEELEKMKEG